MNEIKRMKSKNSSSVGPTTGHAARTVVCLSCDTKKKALRVWRPLQEPKSHRPTRSETNPTRRLVPLGESSSPCRG
ncbi:hypothetical protein P8C59_007241 [Phyllachora maydis]|uniref:Uncharacterized protein n=1 Tax=Phyllachora maydis TaxID=1825666 RepID=A0AAD9ME12_9PEZI|nr:hypothetical protein P8C59_007241 [Phyllachora maydis]